MPTKIFVDNHLLRGMVSRISLERSDALHEFNKLKQNVYEVIIPQVAIGELVSIVMRDFSDDPVEIQNKLKKVYDSIQEVLDVSTCMPPLNRTTIEYALELKSRDTNLGLTDLLIISQALTDPESERFLTTDKNLLNSDVIKEKEKELRTNNDRQKELKIVDGL